MSQIKSSLLSSACAVLLLVSVSTMAHAEQLYGPVTIEGALKAQTTVIENNDLGTDAVNNLQDSQSLEARVRATWKISDYITAMGEVRGVKNYGDGGGIDQDTGEVLGAEDFVELRQYWVQFTSLLGQVPLSAKIGRQRFNESSGIWWNRDFDAVRLSYNTTLLNNFVAIGQNMGGYRTTKDDFRNSDEDLFRVLGETSWQWRYAHFLEARFAYLNDMSGRNNIGSLFGENNRDTTDSDLMWAGVRARGEFAGFVSSRKADYRFDLMGLRGDENIETTAAAAGGLRSVTGNSERDVSGWAFDSLIQVPLPIMAEPELIVGYAFGSGDDDSANSDDHTFRQTGLDSNSGRLGLSTTTINNFGSVLRPDLSNIHILTAGLSVPMFTATDLTGLYHYYRLDEQATSLLTSGITATLNNSSRDLGHGMDLIFSSNLTDEFGLDTGAVGPLIFKTTLGAFRAGDAYGAADDEWSSRGYVELQIRF